MNKKFLLGLVLFFGLITAGLFTGASFLMKNDTAHVNQETETEENRRISQILKTAITEDDSAQALEQTKESEQPSPAKEAIFASSRTGYVEKQDLVSKEAVAEQVEEIFGASIDNTLSPKLIKDCNAVDYKAYIPEMKMDSELEEALSITDPDIEVDAEAAILFDADTKEVLYYKNAVQTMFPASTAKLLTSIVALQWCDEEEKVTIGDEITMIASDSTRAYLQQKQVLTIHDLLTGMLLPSGNDAAYAIAAYVGRKSLMDQEATKEEAVNEFIKLMNQEAAILGLKNSCFKTPDGYDAIGQYTTAYDMGLIGMKAAESSIITAVTRQGSSRNIFPSGEDVTWYSTNKLITCYNCPHVIGLKTGTSTMAGRNLVAAAQEEDRTVVCVIMDSTSTGRWQDAISLLSYGLDHITE